MPFIWKQTIVNFKQFFLTELTTAWYTRCPHPVTRTKNINLWSEITGPARAQRQQKSREN